MKAKAMRGVSWDCDRDGCFNRIKRPKFGAFDGCFGGPGQSFSDVDAAAERRGHFLFLEFKGKGAVIRTGQRILFEQLTRLSPNVHVIVVEGNTETMEVYRIRYVADGTVGPWESCNLEKLRRIVARWYRKADRLAA